MAKKQTKAMQMTNEEKEAREIESNTKWAIENKSLYNPDRIALAMSKTILDLNSKDPEREKGAYNLFQDQLSQLKTSEELQTFESLVRSVPREYKPMVFKFVRGIISEYELTTPSQIAIAELATNAFIRSLWASERLQGAWDGPYLASLSKELDRANRQYLSAIFFLKQMKTPTMNVNIKTKTAYVAQNQQINSGVKSI